MMAIIALTFLSDQSCSVFTRHLPLLTRNLDGGDTTQKKSTINNCSSTENQHQHISKEQPASNSFLKKDTTHMVFRSWWWRMSNMKTFETEVRAHESRNLQMCLTIQCTDPPRLLSASQLFINGKLFFTLCR